MDGASLFRNEQCGAHVPFVQVHLPIAVEQSGGDIADVDCSGAKTAHASDVGQHTHQVVDIAVGCAVLVDRKSGRHHRFVNVGLRAATDWAVVQERSFSAHGGENLSKIWRIDNANNSLPFVLHAYRHAEIRQPAAVVCCAVKRVDHP